MDLFHYPVVLTEANNRLRFFTDGDYVNVDVTPGTYWAYRGSSVPDHPSLYAAIEAALNTVSSSTFAFDVATPTDSDGREGWGITLQRTSGTGHWGFLFSVGTLEPRIFGMNDSDDTVDDVAELRGRYTRWGVWCSPRKPNRKLKNVLNEQYTNRARGAVRQVTRWGQDAVRTFQYPRIAAGHVQPYRNQGEDFARVAGLARHDHGNYFFDVWDAGLGAYADVLVCHDVEAITTLGVLDKTYEIISSPTDSRYADEFDACLRLWDEGEAYDLEFAALITDEGNYRQ